MAKNPFTFGVRLWSDGIFPSVKLARVQTENLSLNQGFPVPSCSETPKRTMLRSVCVLERRPKSHLRLMRGCPPGNRFHGQQWPRQLLNGAGPGMAGQPGDIFLPKLHLVQM